MRHLSETFRLTRSMAATVGTGRVNSDIVCILSSGHAMASFWGGLAKRVRMH